MAKKNRAVSGEEPVEVVEETPVVEEAPKAVEPRAVEPVEKTGDWTLTEDTTVPETEQIVVPEGGVLTLDLAGFTLTVFKKIKVFGTFTVNDSSAEKTGQLVSKDAQAVRVGDFDDSQPTLPKAGKFVLEGGTVKCDNRNAWVVTLFGDSPEVVINGGKILAEPIMQDPMGDEESCMGISGTGSTKGQAGRRLSGGSVTMNGGEIVAIGRNHPVGIFQSNDYTVTVNGGKISADFAAVLSCAGVCTINGGELVKTNTVEQVPAHGTEGSDNLDPAVYAATVSVVSRNYPFGTVPETEVLGGTLTNTDENGKAFVSKKFTETAAPAEVEVSETVVKNMVPEPSKEEMEEMGVKTISGEDAFIKQGKVLLGMDAGNDPTKDKFAPLTNDEIDAIEKHAAEYGESSPE